MPEIRTPMIGQQFWFEYHCEESHQSTHAELWYHSHQQCEVIADAESDGDKSDTFEERCVSCTQLLYQVRFSDGFECSVFEDELMDTPEGFERPAPPSPGPASAGRAEAVTDTTNPQGAHHDR